jgi:hypothetical protein
MAQKHRYEPLPNGWMQADGTVVVLENDNLAGLQVSRIAPLYCDEVAGTNDREHAGSRDLQLHLSVAARDIGDEIATR